LIISAADEQVLGLFGGEAEVGAVERADADEAGASEEASPLIRDVGPHTQSVD
jgi:hypothetical protein